MEIDVLRRTAAEIAAAAVFELYPDVELLGGKTTSVDFSYEFIFPHSIHPHIIEEKMRQIVREKRPIRTLVMVPFSASELLKAQGHYAQAEKLNGEEGLVEVIQVGAFHDLSVGPHLKNTAELTAFKIKAESISDKKMRLTGWCHRTKDELKQFLKKLDQYVEPDRKGESLGLWREGIWLPRGLKFRERLIQFFKDHLFDGAFQVSGPPDGDHFGLHRSLNQHKVAEIWNLGYRESYLQVSFFKETISPLHLIGKTLTILGFDHSTSDKGSTKELVVEDGIGRGQVLARVEKRGDDCTVIAYVERVLEQMLEKNLWVKLENQ